MWKKIQKNLCINISSVLQWTWEMWERYHILQKGDKNMEENKQEKYLRISKEIVNYVGGEDNIQGVAHCATRLRIVLTDNNLADIEN